jgi:hypothetical protein
MYTSFLGLQTQLIARDTNRWNSEPGLGSEVTSRGALNRVSNTIIKARTVCFLTESLPPAPISVATLLDINRSIEPRSKTTGPVYPSAPPIALSPSLRNTSQFSIHEAFFAASTD